MAPVTVRGELAKNEQPAHAHDADERRPDCRARGCVVRSAQDGNTAVRATSIKLPPELDRRLSELARHRKTTRSAIVREALEAFEGGGRLSVASVAGDLAGSLNGPSDLSTSGKHMVGYGR